MSAHDASEARGDQPERPTDFWSAAWLAWHTKVIEGEPAGADAIAAALLNRLIRRLSARFPGVDPAAVSDAVTDALCDYFSRPEIFDPLRGASLKGFLTRRAEHKLRDGLRRLLRQGRHQQIQTQPLLDILPTAGPSPTDEIHNREDVRILVPQLSKVVPAINDRRALQLWAGGERRTAAFAEAWGLSHLPLPNQEAEIKRQKDRLSKKLKRWASKRGIAPPTLVALLANLP